MSEKRILLINHYAGSPDMGMEFRPYYLSREWVKMGYRVDIIAADFSHLRVKNPEIAHDFEEQIIDGIHYHWVHTSRYQGNGVKRALTMAQFVGKLWLHAGKIARELKPDVVITSSTYPLDTFAGQRISKIRKQRGVECSLVHEIHDMWPETLVLAYGMSRLHPFTVLMQCSENSFCKHSDYVVSLPPAAKDYLVQHGMKPEKFLHVPNGVVEEEWENPSPLPREIVNHIDQLKQSGQFVLAFFGSMTRSYALTYLVEAVKSERLSGVSLVMVGNGIIKEELKNLAYGCDRISFFDPIPKKCVPSLIRAVDASYVGSSYSELFRFGICMNKLFDALMGGRPIVYAVDAPNNYITEYACGVSVEPRNVQALTDGIARLAAMTPQERSEMGRNGEEAASKHFSYAPLAKKFASLF